MLSSQKREGSEPTFDDPHFQGTHDSHHSQGAREEEDLIAGACAGRSSVVPQCAVNNDVVAFYVFAVGTSMATPHVSGAAAVNERGGGLEAESTPHDFSSPAAVRDYLRGRLELAELGLLDGLVEPGFLAELGLDAVGALGAFGETMLTECAAPVTRLIRTSLPATDSY